MQTAWRPISDGQTGIAEIVAQLNTAKDYYGSLPSIRAAALCIARPSADNDNAGNAAALASFVRSAVHYVCDPINSELTQTPDVMLTAIHSEGATCGDCDDHVLLFASLAESLGIACDIVAVKFPGTDEFNHVIACPWIDGQQRQIDLCAKNGEQPQYAETLG